MCLMSRDSAVGIATGYRLDDRMVGWSGFVSRRRVGIFLFDSAFRPALGATQSPIHWVPEALSLEVKWQGREADHSLPSSAEVKEFVQLYLHFLNTS
jgi:hypothetical protein